jgi:hypothetical protein
VKVLMSFYEDRKEEEEEEEEDVRRCRCKWRIE